MTDLQAIADRVEIALATLQRCNFAGWATGGRPALLSR